MKDEIGPKVGKLEVNGHHLELASIPDPDSARVQHQLWIFEPGSSAPMTETRLSLEYPIAADDIGDWQVLDFVGVKHKLHEFGRLGGVAITVAEDPRVTEILFRLGRLNHLKPPLRHGGWDLRIGNEISPNHLQALGLPPEALIDPAGGFHLPFTRRPSYIERSTTSVTLDDSYYILLEESFKF